MRKISLKITTALFLVANFATVEETLGEYFHTTYSFEVCNKTETKLSLVYGYFADPTDNDFTLSGWWQIDRNECRSMFTAEFGVFGKMPIYFYATANGNVWSGNNVIKFCAPNTSFEKKIKLFSACKNNEHSLPLGRVFIAREQTIFTLTLE